MAEHEEYPYIVIERRSGGVTSFFWGALLGAGVALLLAPRTGEETQQEIREGARRLKTRAEDRVSEARDTVVGAVERTRDRVQTRIEAVRDTLETSAQQARDAVDAGRRAARETRDDLERRVAEAKDALRRSDDLPFAAAGVPGMGEPVAEVVITEVIVEEDIGPPGLG